MTLDKKLNPFPYATDPELNRIFDSLVDLKVRVNAQFAKAEKIAGFTGDTKFIPLAQAKIELPDYKTIKNPSSSGFYGSKAVPMATVDTQVAAAVANANKHLDEIDEINKPIHAANLKIKEQVSELMVRLGIPSSYTTYEYATTRSKTRRSVSHTAGYIGDLYRVMPTTNLSTERSRLTTYVNDFNRWRTETLAAEEKAKIEKDELTIKTKVLGSPKLVEVLMMSGVNILSELAKAVPGKKAEMVGYCIAQAISNERAKAQPSEDVIETLEDLHADF